MGWDGRGQVRRGMAWQLHGLRLTPPPPLKNMCALGFKGLVLMHILINSVVALLLKAGMPHVGWLISQGGREGRDRGRRKGMRGRVARQGDYDRSH